MQDLLDDLKSLDDGARRKAVETLVELGEPVFDEAKALLDHEVAKWEVLSLLPLLSPERAIPILLEYVCHNREVSTQMREHAKKYIRIKAIEELGYLAARKDSQIDSLLAANNVVEGLTYFIDPEHPHMHEEVRFAVIKALREFKGKPAKEKVKLWEKTWTKK